MSEKSDMPFGVKRSFFLRAAVVVSNCAVVRGGLRYVALRPFKPPDEWPVDPIDGTSNYRPASPPPALGATVVFGVPAFGVFASWMVLVVHQSPTSDAQFIGRMWLAGLWALIAPGLIVTWECRRIGMLHTISESTKDGWDAAEIQLATKFSDRRMNAALLLFGVAVGLGYFFSRGFLAGFLGLDGVGGLELILGVLSTSWLGATMGMGIWGVGTMLVTIGAALKAGPQKLVWNPFNARQIQGIESLSDFAYATGLLFSMGAIFLPGVFSILPGLEPVPRLLAIFMSGLLIAGGLVSFVAPSLRIHRVVRAQRNAATDKLAPAMDSLLASMESPNRSVPFPAEAEGLIALRAALLESSAVPWSSQMVRRAASLLFLPLMITVLARPFGGS